MAPFLAPTVTPCNFQLCYQFRCGTDLDILLDTPYDWNYTVVPQAGMDNRTYPYPRGRLLGGTSSASKFIKALSTSVMH